MFKIIGIICVLISSALLFFLPIAYADQPQEVNTQELLSIINQARGKVVIVNFWASWCPECSKEVQDLAALREKYPEQSLHILGISMDENPSAMQGFVRKQKINYPNLMAAGDVGRSFNVIGVPKTYIYDQQGELLVKEFGSMGYGRLEKLVQEMLQE